MTEWIPRVATAFDVAGIGILVVGFLWSLGLAVWTWRATGSGSAYQRLRTTLGRTLLLGLEVFVAADIIRTVAVAPTLQNVLVLGLIVVIRTFLSFSIQVEVDGSLPWRRSGRPTSRRGAVAGPERSS